MQVVVYRTELDAYLKNLFQWKAVDTAGRPYDSFVEVNFKRLTLDSMKSMTRYHRPASKN